MNILLASATSVISKSICALINEGIIAIPTDTIYGIAGSLTSSKALDKIYAIKGRDYTKPLSIAISSVDQISDFAKVTVSPELLKILLPGPVTLLFERTVTDFPHLNVGSQLIGFRIPDYPLVVQIVKELGSPILLTSANISGDMSPLCMEDFEVLWPRLDLIVDGGRLHCTEEMRAGSTVVDLSCPNAFKIIRNGSALERTKLVLLEFGLCEIL